MNNEEKTFESEAQDSDVITSVVWHVEDYSTWLIDHGFADNEDNINAMCSMVNPQVLHERLVDIGWDVISASVDPTRLQYAIGATPEINITNDADTAYTR